MTDNVVSLHGTFQPPAGQPNVTLIEELERLMDAARAGEIIGMVGSYMHRDKLISYSYAGSVVSYSVIGGLECLKDRLIRLISHRE